MEWGTVLMLGDPEGVFRRDCSRSLVKHHGGWKRWSDRPEFWLVDQSYQDISR